MKYCTHCGQSMSDTAFVCPACGAPVPVENAPYQAPAGEVPYASSYTSPKSRLVTLLLAIFLGELGIHRFYTGKIGTGILWLLTVGGFGVGYIIDIIMIVCGKYKDINGFTVLDWQV